MTEEAPSSFLARWSRRKAASRDTVAPSPPETAEPPPPSLPPLETLGADSDYTAFLARGVSRAVQAQALRIAWASDPAIANFRGMAEYAWDFNAPGYGELAATDDAAAWLGQIVRSGARALTDPADAPSPCPPVAETARPPDPPAAPAEPATDPPAEALPPPMAATVEALPPRRRRHGSAMPA